VLTGPFSPLFDPFFRAGPTRLGPLRAGLGQKIELAGSAGPARFSAGLHMYKWAAQLWPGEGRPVRHDWKIGSGLLSIRSHFFAWVGPKRVTLAR
jgi:hypothetical protein